MDEIVDVNTLFGPLPAASNDLTVESLLEMLQQHQIGKACALSTLGMLLDPSVGNTVTRATCQEHETLVPVATFNPTMYFGDAAPLHKAREEGFKLARFFPNAQAWPIDFAPFRALVLALQETALPLMIDVHSSGDITALARIVNDSPIPVILSGVNVNMLAEALAVLRERSNWHLETSRLLAPGAIKAVVDSVGAGRLLFGSSAPSQPVASVMDTLHFAGLDGGALNQVLGGNARTLLQL